MRAGKNKFFQFGTHPNATWVRHSPADTAFAPPTTTTITATTTKETKMNPNPIRYLLATGLLVLASIAIPGRAADTPPTASAENDKLAPVRAQIAQRNWGGAIAELQRINEPTNADWNNLMGYTQRKAATPDYPAAERYYDAALRINPAHRGALEYSGELYLMLGQLPRAEQRLAALDKACFMPCAEYTDLKKAVERYKTSGMRYVPGTY